MVDKRKTRIKELNKKINELERKQSPLVDEKNRLTSQIDLENNKSLLGKCFKYRNSYGSGEKWWLYTKVVDVGDWDVVIIGAEDCGGGFIHIVRERHSASSYKNEGSYTEISAEEFNKNFNEILEKIKKSD